MIVVTRYDVGAGDEDTFAMQARTALEALAARPGYLSGSVGRATDDPASWVLVTSWRDVGSYRRALGNYDVKVRATPLLARARDEVSAFEELVVADPGGPARSSGSDLSGGWPGRTADA